MTERLDPTCTSDVPPAVERWLEHRKDVARRLATQTRSDDAEASARIMDFVANDVRAHEAARR